jgi:hypothetical protein
MSPAPILSHINPTDILKPYYTNNRFNIILLSTPMSSENAMEVRLLCQRQQGQQ